MQRKPNAAKQNDGFFRNIAWVLGLVWESGPALTLANAGLTMVLSVLPLAGLYLTKLIIDAVASGIGGGDRNLLFRHVGTLILLSAIVLIVDRAFAILLELVRNTQTYIVIDRVYDILHAKSTAVDIEYYENSDYYDALHRAQAEAPYRPTRILDAAFNCCQNAISVVALAGLLLTFHWSVPVVLAMAAVPDLLIKFHFARRFYAWARKQTPAERQALYFTTVLMADGHAKEIRLFDLGHVFMQRFRRLRQQIRQERLALLRKRSIADLAGQTSSIIPSFAVYAFVVYRAVQGSMTVGDLVMCYQAIQRGQAYLTQLMNSFAVLYENNLFVSNVHEFLALEPKVLDPPHPRPVNVAEGDGIRFHNVGFRYPNSDRIVLDAINLHIRPGEHIALVGENGSGKSTLVKLLLRLYDPASGSITLDGVDLRELSLAELRRKISVVFQDYARYHLSVKENIWFGDVHAPPEEERVARAARNAGADKLIMGLPGRFDTLLGKWFAGGQELSVGEWQKIALARAFFREADLIIMDEPSSALDPKAEFEVFSDFHRLSLGRSAVLISHRLSTVKMADRIYFLENGRIVEKGSHDELIDRRGKYAFMFERQAQHYR
jgi:ATP-binding cassette subfamily B protein